MPPADNSRFLIEAAKRRHAEARERCEQVIATAASDSATSTVVAIAAAAGVSRSWLYTQSDLLDAIALLKTRPAGPGPKVRPASEDFIRRRLETALARNKELRHQVADLSAQLEAVHGELRRTRTLGTATRVEE